MDFVSMSPSGAITMKSSTTLNCVKAKSKTTILSYFVNEFEDILVMNTMQKSAKLQLVFHLLDI